MCVLLIISTISLTNQRMRIILNKKRVLYVQAMLTCLWKVVQNYLCFRNINVSILQWWWLWVLKSLQKWICPELVLPISHCNSLWTSANLQHKIMCQNNCLIKKLWHISVWEHLCCKMRLTVIMTTFMMT